MRIAFLTTEYPTEHNFAGGLASYVQRTAKLLISLGHDVEVFTLSKQTGSIEDDGVIVHRVQRSTRLEGVIRRLKVFSKYYGYTKHISRSFALQTSLKQRHRIAPFDIVQAANCMACGFAPTLRKIIPIVTRHSGYMPAWREADGEPETRHDLQKDRLEFIQAKRSDAVYAPSRTIAGLVKKHEGIEVEVVQPPFDRSHLDQLDLTCPKELQPEEYGLFFGTLKRLKGCDRLISILPELLDKNPKMRFVFVGNTLSNELGEAMKKQMDETFAPYGDRVLVVNACPHEELFRYVANARFVVLPSRIDNLPNTCLEAMALGRVVVGTYGASFDEMIEEGVSGILVEQNEAEIAAGMQRAWDLDKTNRKEMGDSAKHFIDSLHPEHAVQKLIELYERVIAEKKETRKPHSNKQEIST